MFDSLRRSKGEVVWRIPELPNALGAARAAIATMLEDVTRNGVPIAPTALEFEMGALVRPSNHRRCFYSSMVDPAQGLTDHICVKGTEPLLTDELGLLAGTKLPSAWRDDGSELTWIDFWPIREHKVPMALTTREAMDEAEIGHELFSAYQSRYQELPQLPLPLLVVKWPGEIVEQFFGLMKPMLSPFAEDIVRRLLADGAACYVYHYPVAPFPRVRDVSREASAAAGSRLEALRGRGGDPQKIVEGWIQLFVRILALGYLPATPSQAVTGQSVQEQNVVVGGGFLDLDSVRAIKTIQDPDDLTRSYALSVSLLTQTIARYLFDGVDVTRRPRAPEILTSVYVHDLLAEAMSADRKLHGEGAGGALSALPPFSRGADALLRLATQFSDFPRIGDLDKLIGVVPR